MRDETFEIESIELVYGNEEKQVRERVMISDESTQGSELLDIEVVENGAYSEPNRLQVTLYDWATRLVGIVRLHVENMTTMEPEMYEAMKQINEDEDSPFKGMINMPNEEDVIFKREEGTD